MSSSQTSGSLIFWFLVLAVTCYFLIDHVTASTAPIAKRDVHRAARAKYRVGYMFGKRSSAVATPSALFDVVSRYVISRKDLESLILRNPEVLSDVLTILDKNGDGYISASDLV